uniref:Lysozyme n=1 Tax=Rhabditophanes sp. KR3021 TaxID=114890 RepID=A0AC35TJD8_9BILA
MFIKLLLISALMGVVFGKDCLSCICDKESNCTPAPCKPDKGSDSCGYFQIKLPYYIDCGKPDKRPGESDITAWQRCSLDLNCATTCVNNYIKRYSKLCPQYSGCEQIARLHNGGPYGCNKHATDGYWNAIKKCSG